MGTTVITRKTLIGEIVNQYPETAEVLLGIGMHCLGCAIAHGETVEQAAEVHGIDLDALLAALNKE